MSLMEKEWYIQAPWGRICIIAWGDCYDPPVLLCPGFLDSAVSFRPLLKLLPKNFYYIGIELPGNGKSDNFPPGLMLSTHDLVYAVQTVVKHFRWKSFVYIGHSLGGILGKLYNLCYPGRIEKYVEIDPINFFGIPPEDFSKWYDFFFTDYYKNYDKFNTPRENIPKIKREQALKSMKANRPLLNDEQANAVLDRLSEPLGEGYIRYTFDNRLRKTHNPVFSPEHIKLLMTNLKTPTLTIAASESLKKKLFQNTAFLLDENEYPNRNLRCKHVEGGHDLHISHPQRISSFLSQFLLYGLDGLDGRVNSKL